MDAAQVVWSGLLLVLAAFTALAAVASVMIGVVLFRRDRRAPDGIGRDGFVLRVRHEDADAAAAPTHVGRDAR